VVKKTAVNLTIGTSAAAIGAIKGMPLLVEGAAVLGAIPLAPIIHKFIDEVSQLKWISSIFFGRPRSKPDITRL
jgi:hypothetical protein